MKNCVRIGWSSPSWVRICSICSAFALSPAMTAAGSPGVRRSIRNTNSATISITGTVASEAAQDEAEHAVIPPQARRARTGAAVSRLHRPPSAALALAAELADTFSHVPEERHRRGEHAVDVLAVADRLKNWPRLDGGADLELAHAARPRRSPSAWPDRSRAAKSSRSFSIFGSHGQPNVALSQLALSEAGHHRIEDVGRDPRGRGTCSSRPRSAGSFLARRETTVCQSHRLHVDLEADLSPAATWRPARGCVERRRGRSSCRSTIGVPS